METTALREVALGHLPLSGFHHLLAFVVLVTLWSRREAAGRVLPTYLAAAFGTASFALLSQAGARAHGAVAVILTVLWLREALSPGGRIAFRRTPRFRLTLMVIAGAFALSYPGYSGELPPFIFSPLGVTLSPTLIAALALLNATEGPTDRLLHWTTTAAGLLFGTLGVAAGVWQDGVLLFVALYAALLLIRGRKLLPSDDVDAPRSVDEIRSRIYSRRSLLPGPRDTRRRSRSSRRRLR
ncbi:MAG: hypothetical protein GF400_07175 [Candidatus Eisenbacteria bacterium]|nr:hypothetical protein [Candidatus Eisenbacteria bacterium]